MCTILLDYSDLYGAFHPLIFNNVKKLTIYTAKKGLRYKVKIKILPGPPLEKEGTATLTAADCYFFPEHRTLNTVFIYSRRRAQGVRHKVQKYKTFITKARNRENTKKKKA